MQLKIKSFQHGNILCLVMKIRYAMLFYATCDKENNLVLHQKLFIRGIRHMKSYEIYNEYLNCSLGMLLYYQREKTFIVELEDDLD